MPFLAEIILSVERLKIWKVLCPMMSDTSGGGDVMIDGIGIRTEQGARIGQMVYCSAAMLEVARLVGLVAQHDTSVLLEGETGVGKGLVAKGIHEQSRRRAKRFVRVDCGTLPAELIESELFGHKAGAYTSAVGSREGLIRAADGGTLFLDEVSNLPLRLQPRLLGLLQERRIRPVGADAEFDVNIRVISASNRPLIHLVRAGQFTADLYYRLQTFPIEVPPLRSRPEDIPCIADEYLRHCDESGPALNL